MIEKFSDCDIRCDWHACDVHCDCEYHNDSVFVIYSNFYSFLSLITCLILLLLRTCVCVCVCVCVCRQNTEYHKKILIIPITTIFEKDGS